MLNRLATALEPGWHARRTAGRVERHTEILRGIARQLPGDPTSPDRPESALEAEQRLSAYLDELQRSAPRAGLGAATGEFVDHVVKFTERCGGALFACFDDDRIPPTSNQLEGFFGKIKRAIRRATGEKSTANSPIRNLGNDFLLAAGRLGSTSSTEFVGAVHNLDSASFENERRRIDESELPARRQRSMARAPTKWLNGIRESWQTPQRAATDESRG